DLDRLLADVDGRQVTLDSGRRVTLQTADAEVVFNDMNFIERFLDLIADPNIALLLLSLGTLALFIELVHPGVIFPGVFGVIAIVIGFFALSVLPFNWAGVALIVIAFILFGLELFVLVNILRIRSMPAQMGMETTVGRSAVTRSLLDPTGFVFIDGEYWSAESEEGKIERGEQVVITEVKGLKLKVKKQQPEGG
ncbi:MAG: NfeD family protein, partial [Dehalococcoidia bacterium]|nr:NfeD family protein [Dehalococcoidia bacterium]